MEVKFVLFITLSVLPAGLIAQNYYLRNPFGGPAGRFGIIPSSYSGASASSGASSYGGNIGGSNAESYSNAISSSLGSSGSSASSGSYSATNASRRRSQRLLSRSVDAEMDHMACIEERRVEAKRLTAEAFANTSRSFDQLANAAHS